MKTLSGIKLPDNYFAVLKWLAGLHGMSIQEYCVQALEFAIEDTIENDYEHIGRLVCNPWKELLRKMTTRKE